MSPTSPTPMPDFYPRPPRGGRHADNESLMIAKAISTHALREEGDAGSVTLDMSIDISTHALREEGDAGRRSILPAGCGFLPTPSARRATGIYWILKYQTL